MGVVEQFSGFKQFRGVAQQDSDLSSHSPLHLLGCSHASLIPDSWLFCIFCSFILECSSLKYLHGWLLLICQLHRHTLPVTQVKITLPLGTLHYFDFAKKKLTIIYNYLIILSSVYCLPPPAEYKFLESGDHVCHIHSNIPSV